MAIHAATPISVPRQRATTKKAVVKKDDVPVFLKKTYHMINTSEDGRTFVVKDPDTFASDVIPQFFKHNNFSSFVRQLNFYGFRKIKDQAIRIVSVDDDSSGWWRFKHENFLRGRPDLLTQIKKANQVNAADQHEVDKLKEEVSYLRSEVGQLSSMVQQMSGMLRQMTGHNFSGGQSSNKKRRLETSPVGSLSIDPVGSLSVPNGPMQSISQPIIDCDEIIRPGVSLLDPMVSDADLLVEEFPVEYEPGTVTPPTEPVRRSCSADVIASMFDFVKEDSELNEDMNGSDVDDAVFQPDSANSSAPPIVCNRSVSFGDTSQENGRLDPKLSSKLNDAVSKLPKSLQETFVERIVENVASPDAYQKHVDAVSVLATAAAIEAQIQTSSSDHPNEATGTNGARKTSKVMLPVAAAALGAFLAKYGNAPSDPPYDPAKR